MLTEHADQVDNDATIKPPEMYRRYDDARNDFEFVTDKRFEQLTVEAKKYGATVIRGEPEWNRRLEENGASAVTLGDLIVFREKVCISEILEETRHFYQNKINMNNDKPEPLRTLLNEMEAREYIFNNAAKYHVPRKELDFLKTQYENYRKQLNDLERP